MAGRMLAPRDTGGSQAQAGHCGRLSRAVSGDGMLLSGSGSSGHRVIWARVIWTRTASPGMLGEAARHSRLTARPRPPVT
jgi:hypothetical protein